MPTGYTADIEKGISFEQYVWGCARNFGALILMRDDPSDAPVPDKFEPASYYEEWLEKANAKLAELRSMDDAAIAAAAEQAYAAGHAADLKRAADKATLRLKYEEMLAKVEAWNPPSSDHTGLKEFMATQIRESIDFDCSTKYAAEYATKRLEPMDWYKKEITEAIRSVARYTEEREKEIDRTAGRNRWIQQLRSSVPQPQADAPGEGQ